ncbi:MAG: SAM-dependent methyltransferase [Pseudobdellovibrionaceae bacterium]
MFKLSRRMQLIFDHLLPGQPVWDFCCDHGYIGLNAYESGLFPEVHFVDQVPHIIQQLQLRFQNEYWQKDSAIQARFLAITGEDVAIPLSGSVIIAGVGAHTIFKILNTLQQKNLLQAQRLILGPQRDEEWLLKMLLEVPGFHYKRAADHCEIVERGRSRKLLIFDKN